MIRQFFALIFGLPIFIYAVLALAHISSPSSCNWSFPKWFACVLSVHEGLAAGLIGAAGALFAAWLAWNALQQQIKAEQDRLMADRMEAERLLSEDLTDYAEGMAAAWRLLVALPDEADRKSSWGTRQATAYMAARLSRAEHLENYRAMAQILGWDSRRKYKALLTGLEELKPFTDPDSISDTRDVLNVIRNLADHFEYCLPITSKFFGGLWRRSPKAMSFAEYVERIGGDQYPSRSN
jgi:hypothetical protein